MITITCKHESVHCYFLTFTGTLRNPDAMVLPRGHADVDERELHGRHAEHACLGQELEHGPAMCVAVGGVHDPLHEVLPCELRFLVDPCPILAWTLHDGVHDHDSFAVHAHELWDPEDPAAMVRVDAACREHEELLPAELQLLGISMY